MAPMGYRAYLLRLWVDNPGGSWRASLDSPQVGDRISFASLGELLRYLEEQTGVPPSPADESAADVRKSPGDT